MASVCRDPFFYSFPFGLARKEIILDDTGNVKDYRILCINRVFEEICGYSAAEIEGKTILDLNPDTDHEILAKIEFYGHELQHGGNNSFEYFL